MKLKQRLARTLLIWTVLVAFMMLFQPSNLPVIVLIVPFILLFLAFSSLWSLLSDLQHRYFVKIGNSPKQRAPLGVAVCVSAVLLIVLQSLGQLTLRDVVTVVAIVILGYLYLTRSRVTNPKR